MPLMPALRSQKAGHLCQSKTFHLRQGHFLYSVDKYGTFRIMDRICQNIPETGNDQNLKFFCILSVSY